MNLENLKTAMIINRYAVEPRMYLVPGHWDRHFQIADLREGGMKVKEISAKLNLRDEKVRYSISHVKWWKEYGCDDMTSRLIEESNAWNWGLTWKARSILGEIGIEDMEGLHPLANDQIPFEIGRSKNEDDFTSMFGGTKSLYYPKGRKIQVSREIVNEIRKWMGLEPFLKAKNRSVKTKKIAGLNEMNAMMDVLTTLSSCSPEMIQELAAKITKAEYEAALMDNQLLSLKASKSQSVSDSYSLDCLGLIANLKATIVNPVQPPVA